MFFIVSSRYMLRETESTEVQWHFLFVFPDNLDFNLDMCHVTLQDECAVEISRNVEKR